MPKLHPIKILKLYYVIIHNYNGLRSQSIPKHMVNLLWVWFLWGHDRLS